MKDKVLVIASAIIVSCPAAEETRLCCTAFVSMKTIAPSSSCGLGRYDKRCT